MTEPRLLLDRDAIAATVARLGSEIAADHRDGVVLVGVLKGAAILLAAIFANVLFMGLPTLGFLFGTPGETYAAFADVLATAFKEAMKRTPTQPGRSPVRLLGPAECPVFRLNNFYRFHFQVQSDSSAVLHEVLRNVLALAKPPSGVEFQVDIDPYSML